MPPISRSRGCRPRASFRARAAPWSCVRGFAGDDLDAAVFFDLDDRYLVERDLECKHYDVDVEISH